MWLVLLSHIIQPHTLVISLNRLHAQSGSKFNVRTQSVNKQNAEFVFFVILTSHKKNPTA